jgi:mannose-6-phosphate isomerase-like protein (cupin superfamily)
MSGLGQGFTGYFFAFLDERQKSVIPLRGRKFGEGRNRMEHKPINLREKMAKFSDHWSPKVIAQMNDYHFKLVKFQGDFVWHIHDDTDEVFIVLDGEMSIEFRDGKVDLKQGDLFVVPKGVEHKPFSKKQCEIMLVEPAGTINTGDAGGDLTAEDNVWI